MAKPKRDEIVFSTFGQVLVNHEDWNWGTASTIERHLSRGAKPHVAAMEAGVSINVFNRWMEVDSFRMWVELISSRHQSKLRTKIEADIHLIEDPEKRANARMKYLERVDSDFGTKHIDIKEDRTISIPDPEDVDPEIESLVKDIQENVDDSIRGEDN